MSGFGALELEGGWGNEVGPNRTKSRRFDSAAREAAPSQALN